MCNKGKPGKIVASHFRFGFGIGNMALEIRNSSFDSDDGSTIFITQEPSVSRKIENEEQPHFNLDIESLMDTSNDSGNSSVSNLDKSLDVGDELLQASFEENT